MLQGEIQLGSSIAFEDVYRVEGFRGAQVDEPFHPNLMQFLAYAFHAQIGVEDLCWMLTHSSYDQQL